jgi:Dolichyl-phosphate-mannose-protein mannosyltransferase
MIMKNPAGKPLFPNRGWLWFRTVLTGLVLCRGVVLLCVLPPFEAWDEYQHIGYMAYLAETGQRPVLGQADVPLTLLCRLSAFPQSRSALRQLGGCGAVDYATYWSCLSRGEPPTAGDLTHLRFPLYQAQHGPLYYRLATPLFSALGGVADLRTTIGGLRLVNLVLTAGAVWIALGIVRRLVREVRLAALCGLLIATQPLFLTNGARVANDALGVFLATAAVAMAMNLTRRHSVAATLGLGLVVGMAVLAKTVNLGLLPFVAACWLTALIRNRDGAGVSVRTIRALGSASILLMGFLLVTHSEFLANFKRFGSPTVMQEAVVNRAAGRGTANLVRTASSIAWRDWAQKLWFRDNVMSGGWSWAGKHEHLRSRHEILAGIGLLGWAWAIVPVARVRILRLFHDPLCPLLCLALLLSYTGAMAYHVVQSRLCWGSISTNPWYAAAAYPWFLLLVSGGAFAWPVGRFRWLLPGAIAMVFVEAEACTVLGSMTALYAGYADWSAALRRLAVLQPSAFGTTTLYTAMAGVLAFDGLALCAVLRLVFEPSTAGKVPPVPHIFSKHKAAAAPKGASQATSSSQRSTFGDPLLRTAVHADRRNM